MTNDLISLIANLALTLSFIVALIFGVAQVNAAARDRRERLTLETLRTFQTRDFAELATFINSVKMPTNRHEMTTLPINEQVMLFQFAQGMEHLGMLVADRLINIDLVDKIIGSYVATTWAKYKVLYTNLREKLPDPFLGEYFQWLAERMDERMKNAPREPFYLTYRNWQE